MNQNPTGETSSVQERLKSRDDLLDQYESKIGLPSLQELQVSKEIEGYLALSREDMDRLSPEDCAEIGVRLEQTSFYMQRFINKETSHVTWAKASLRLHIADRLGNYKGSFTQQENQAIKEDGYATKLDSMITYAQQRIDRLAYLSSSLTRLADRLYHLQMSKSRRTGT